MKAFLIGAGASRGTFDDQIVPVAKEFGSVLASIDSAWRTNYPALYKVVEHLGLDPTDWALEPVWSCIDYYAKLECVIPRTKPWSNESEQIKKAILTVFGERCDRMVAGAHSTLLRVFRSELRSGDALISLNYDTVAERLAAGCGVRLRVPDRADLNSVRFAKPHGSTSWTLNLAGGRVTWSTYDGAPLLTSLTHADIDQRREPLLLGAVPIKSELIKEVQHWHSVPEVFNVISTQWRSLVEAVRDAKTLVVIGYSFPQEDEYGRFLVGEGLRLRTKGLSVEFFERREKEAERGCAIGRAFQGRLDRLVYRGPVEARSTAA